LLTWVGGVVIGAWDREQSNADGYIQFGQTFNGEVVTGSPTYTIQPELDTVVIPLGNNNGWATSFLDGLRWAGAPEGRYQNDADRYPDTDNPFYINIVRDDNRAGPLWDVNTTYAESETVVWDDKGWRSTVADNLGNEPGINPPRWEEIESGYGWTALLDKQSTSRPSIVNYKVGIYPDADMTPGTEIYFTGAFQDIDGVFQSSAPSGQWTINPVDVYFALIYSPDGDAQQGIFTLLEGTDDVTAQFWSHSQA
jgi:hypothetical protein